MALDPQTTLYQQLVLPSRIRMPPLLSHLLRPLPLFPLQLALQAFVNVIVGRHPQLCDRLPPLHGQRVGLEPSDLPFAFLLEPRANSIAVKVVRSLEPKAATVSIRGAMTALMGLADGTYDADALFFSRDISVEGDVEVAVALRNAIDDAEIDLLDEVAACIGPLSYLLPLSRTATSTTQQYNPDGHGGLR